MMKKAALFVDAHAGHNKELAQAISLEHDQAQLLAGWSQKSEKSTASLFNFAAIEDKDKYEAAMIKVQERNNKVTEAMRVLSEKLSVSEALFEAILAQKKLCNKAIADKESAQKKLEKAKPAEKATAESNFKIATENCDKVMAETEVVVTKNMKEALKTKYAALAEFYKLALSESQGQLEISNGL